MAGQITHMDLARLVSRYPESAKKLLDKATVKARAADAEWHPLPQTPGFLMMLQRDIDHIRVCIIPYHTIPYHTIPYHTIPYHTIPYHTKPNHAIPYHTILYYTVLYCTVLYCTVLYCTVRYDTIR